ncbi:MAG: response regulator [Magnetococcales bacterium]|nr:response regulator [Magnetococcales bacterium]
MSARPRVLIVDDSETIREMVQMVLENLDAHVVAQGTNGKEGVELYRQHKPDMLLTDIEMPEMDGIDASKIIKKEFPNSYILMLSSVDPEAAMDFVFHAGAEDFVRKNEDLETLAAEIEPHLKKCML